MKIQKQCTLPELNLMQPISLPMRCPRSVNNGLSLDIIVPTIDRLMKDKSLSSTNLFIHIFPTIKIQIHVS